MAHNNNNNQDSSSPLELKPLESEYQSGEANSPDIKTQAINRDKTTQEVTLKEKVIEQMPGATGKRTTQYFSPEEREEHKVNFTPRADGNSTLNQTRMVEQIPEQQSMHVGDAQDGEDPYAAINAMSLEERNAQRPPSVFKPETETLSESQANIFVMDENGEFYAQNSKVSGPVPLEPTIDNIAIHHSSFLAGKPVAAAGGQEWRG